MKNKVTLTALILAVAFTACNTTYKNSQTPDDLYYSPVKEVAAKEEVREERTTDREETEIRMTTRDPRWRYWEYDHYRDYRYHPYRYGYTYGYYYNPYYYPYPVYGPYIRVENPRNSTPRMVNLGAYQPQTATVKDPKTGQVRTITPNNTYNNSNTTTAPNRTRRVINSRSNDSYNNNSRTYSPAPSQPSTNSGNRSSAPVSRPSRN